MKIFRVLLMCCVSLMCLCTSCTASPAAEATAIADTPQAELPNPASVFCEEQGNLVEIRTIDGSQTGMCIFPDGSECEEWAYYRQECVPASQNASAVQPTEIQAVQDPAEIASAPTLDPSLYEGWWEYTNAGYGFTILLPEDWVAEETSTSDPLMNGHLLTLRPEYSDEAESIRMTFRRSGEDFLLWPTGVGEGEFVEQGTLDVAGQAARRYLLVCPNGEVTAIWYHGSQEQSNITLADMEFGFIFSGPVHCQGSAGLEEKTQLLGELIIASLAVP
jgi:putative hemolysin